MPIHGYFPSHLKFQERDFEILKAVWENRFLNRELLLALFPPDHHKTPAHVRTPTPKRTGTNLDRRLHKLFQQGFLRRFRTVIGGELIYALDKGGADLLRTRQFPLSFSLDWKEKNRALSPPFTDHTLMVARFRTALTVALKERPTFTLPHFERESKDLKAEWKRQGARVFVVPDAFFLLRDENQPEGRQRAAYFLEADRSTMQLSRLLEKYTRYSQMYQDRQHQERFNIPNFRVLTITKSRERATNLLALLTADVIGRKKNGDLLPNPIPRAHLPFFYFTTEQAYQAHSPNVLAAIWQRADNPQEPRAVIGSPLPLRS